MSKMTLYGIWLSGPTYKAGLALSLMGQTFAYKHVDLRAGAHKQPEYLAINRFGQVPALVDGDLKLCQSGSILLYLADKFGKMGGKTPEEKARVREWLFWEFDKLAPNVYRPRAIKRGFMKADDNVYQLYTGLANDGLKVLEASLAKLAFLVGSEPMARSSAGLSVKFERLTAEAKGRRDGRWFQGLEMTLRVISAKGHMREGVTVSLATEASPHV